MAYRSWLYWTMISRRLITSPLWNMSVIHWTMRSTGSSLEPHRLLSGNANLPLPRALTKETFETLVGNTLLGLSTSTTSFLRLLCSAQSANSVNRWNITFLDDDWLALYRSWVAASFRTKPIDLIDRQDRQRIPLRSILLEHLKYDCLSWSCLIRTILLIWFLCDCRQNCRNQGTVLVYMVIVRHAFVLLL